MPYYGQKLAIKVKFYGKVVRMAKKCYLFLNVLFNPQILSHQKVKLVGESLRKYLIAALGGDPKVHSAGPLQGAGGRTHTHAMCALLCWTTSLSIAGPPQGAGGRTPYSPPFTTKKYVCFNSMWILHSWLCGYKTMARYYGRDCVILPQGLSRDEQILAI